MNNYLSDLFRREQDNLFLLAALLMLVPFVWWFLLGWSPGLLIDQHDNLYSGIIYKQQFMKVDADWHRFLYWPQLLGGVKVHDVTGSLPLVQALIFLGAGIVLISNLSILILQVMFGYFSAKLVTGLAATVLESDDRAPIAALIFVGILFAFLPVLGGRLTIGHQAIIQGLFVFLCMTTLVLNEMQQKRSLMTVLLSVLVLSNVFQYNGFQTMYYSILFGGPITLALILSQPGYSFFKRCGLTVFPIAVFACAIVFSIPKLYGLLDNGLGDDTSRVIGQSLIYSYTTASAADWLTSIPWSPELIPASRPESLQYEVNYPFGALALLLLLPRINKRLLVVYAGVMISLLTALIISMNFSPLSTLMADNIPLLQSFRVPARAILPVLIFISLLGTSVLIVLGRMPDQWKQGTWKAPLACGLLLVFGLTLPTLLADLILFLLVLALFIARKWGQQHREVYWLTLALFTGSGINAFEARINPPIADPFPEEVLAEFRETILQQAPTLAQPLNRVHTDLLFDQLGRNTLFALGFSSVTGYWFAPSRYGRLFFALNDREYLPSASVYHNHSQSPGFSLMNQLYNVTHIINMVGDDLVVTPLQNTLGKAWFSKTYEWSEGFHDLARNLKSKNTEVLRKSAVLLSSDSATAPLAGQTLNCSAAKVDEVIDRDIPVPLTIKVTSAGTCLLTIAMNYTDLLQATNQAGKPLVMLPTYGALSGVIVPEGTSTITVDAVPKYFYGIELSYLVALVMLIAITYLTSRDTIRKPRLFE